MKEDKTEVVKAIFKDFIRQYEKSNSLSVGMLPTGENVIYKKIKITDNQVEFMKAFVEED